MQKKTNIVHFDMLKRIALLENKLPEKEKGFLKQVYTIVYGNEENYDWKLLTDTLNHEYESFSDRLHAAAPQLKDVESQICYLSKIELRDGEIAALLHLTIPAIQMKKNHIRHILKMQKRTKFMNELDRIVFNRNIC
jgi:DNA-binding CsgD family transcriptional regulator